MKLLHVVPVGDFPGEMLDDLAPILADTFRIPCEILPSPMCPAFAFHRERQQYHSSEILYRMQGWVRPNTWRMLGVTAVDLYIPILTFVFGEAQMGGPCAIVSAHRLRQEFYGLEQDSGLLQDRLAKECIHEVGHTLDLSHCGDYRCAMAASHAVEWIDLKEGALCAECGARAYEIAP